MKPFDMCVQQCIAILSLIVDGSVKPYIGLCGHMNILMMESTAYNNWLLQISTPLLQSAREWEHYSGNPKFPVVLVDGSTIPLNTLAELQYRQAYVQQTLYTGEYGEMRKQLAKHFINKLRNMKE